MSNSIRRDDNYLNRLSSFLYWEGSFHAKNITRIKNNVFLVKDGDDSRFIFKRHHKKDNVLQQWDFFTQIDTNMIAPFVRYSNGRKVIKDGNQYLWTLTPYLPGRKLNYKNQVDRKNVVKAINDFHKNASEIYVDHRIKKQLFFLRWYNRLQTFKKTEYLFIKYGYETLYKDIVKKTERYIQVVSNYPWKILQREAEEKGLWVHGDVASHNFIQHEDRTYLIDFDLLLCTTQFYDFIQLGQRFLPYIDWDVEKLLAYNMVKERNIPIWLMSIAIPSDFLREWLHFLSRQRSDHMIGKYLVEMEENWIKRNNFVKTAKLVLK